MDQEKKLLINNELAKAGEDQQMKAMLEQLEKCRITPEKEIPPREFLFKLFGIPCFPRGELVALTGKEKSGKTFICSILMALCTIPEALSMSRNTDKPLRALWYDTEQSEESTQEILVERIMKMVSLQGENENENEASPQPSPIGEGDVLSKSFPSGEDLGEACLPFAFNVRSLSWRERMPLFEVAIRQYKPDIVILDGIRDLVDDINDGVLSQEVVESLMRMASECHCCIVSVLHQNKSSEDKNLRGWIGTELAYKAFEVYETTKDGDRIFCFAQTRTRKYDIPVKMKFIVNKDGLPELCTIEELLANEYNKSPNKDSDGGPSLNKEFITSRAGEPLMIDYRAAFTRCMPREDYAYQASVIQKNVMTLLGMTSPYFYQKWRELAIRDGIIRQAPKDVFGHVMYYRPANKPNSARVDPPSEESKVENSLGGEGDIPF